MKYNKEKREIILDRELNKLDKFAIDFTKVLEKYTPYVIISGYISILLGRSRATEDIDVFIENISEEKFYKLYEKLNESGFWCLNSEDEKEVYNYLKCGTAIRFAIKDKIIPNFEVKFPKTNLDKETFKDCIKVLISTESLIISSLERQIAFKRYYLKSDKDIEDALHIEQVFTNEIDNSKINIIKKQILNNEK